MDSKNSSQVQDQQIYYTPFDMIFFLFPVASVGWIKKLNIKVLSELGDQN